MHHPWLMGVHADYTRQRFAAETTRQRRLNELNVPPGRLARLAGALVARLAGRATAPAPPPTAAHPRRPAGEPAALGGRQ